MSVFFMSCFLRRHRPYSPPPGNAPAASVTLPTIQRHARQARVTARTSPTHPPSAAKLPPTCSSVSWSAQADHPRLPCSMERHQVMGGPPSRTMTVGRGGTRDETPKLLGARNHPSRPFACSRLRVRPPQTAVTISSLTRKGHGLRRQTTHDFFFLPALTQQPDKPAPLSR